MKSCQEKVSDHWSHYEYNAAGGPSGRYWLEVNQIQQHINQRISGNSDINWIEYTLLKYFSDRLPVEYCLSLGCGSGRLERTLAKLGMFIECDAYDIAEGSIALAQEYAKREDLDCIHYYTTDINKISLESHKYDVVFVESAMHHFEKLEHICEQIRHSLKPGGLFIINEYVGPKRFRFPARQKELADCCLAILPTRYRRLIRPISESHEAKSNETYRMKKDVVWYARRLADKIQDGTLLETVVRKVRYANGMRGGRQLVKERVNFPSPRDVIAADPSEAIRSDEIIPIVEKYFTIVEQKNWGGNLLQFLLDDIAGNFTDFDTQSRAWLQILLDIEDNLILSQEIESDFAYIVSKIE